MPRPNLKTLILLLPLSVLISANARAADYHHVHLIATDPVEAAHWYADTLGGVIPDSVPRGDRVYFGDTVFVFFKKAAGFPGSKGSGLDRLAFAFPDVDAKLERIRSSGAKNIGDAMTVGDIRVAFFEDPYGTRIEIFQHAELTGLQSIHLSTPDVEGTMQWYEDTFGGEREQFLGLPFLPALRYGNIALIFDRGKKNPEPTKGRSFDHLGFSFPDLDAAAKRLKAQGVQFSLNPMPFGKMKISFVDGPDNVRIEVVQPAP